MFSHTFPTQELQFLPYKPPLEPKKKKSPKKAVHSGLGDILGTKPEPIIGEEGRAIPAPTPPGVEAIDLTCLVSEGNCGLSDDEGRVSSDISCDATFSPKIDHQTARSELFIDKPTSQDDTSNERSSQPVTLGDSRQENTVAIEYSQTGSDTTTSSKDCPLESHLGRQTGDRLDVTVTSNPDRRGEERSTKIEDATNSVAIRELESQASGPPRYEPAPMQATADDSLPLSIRDSNGEGVIYFVNPSLTANLQQATQGGSDNLLETTTHQPQQSIHKMATETGKTSIIIELSSVSSNNGSDDDTDENKSHTPPPPTRKRKRTALFRNNGQFFNHPSSANPLSATQQSGYTTHDKHDSTSSNRGSRKSKNRRKSTPRPRTNDDFEHVEYEVKKIVGARIYEGKLQYRAEWVGHEYEDDPTWYNASNFKNSPLILGDFHDDNPTYPGPPRRLDVWIQCWKNTADHSDDDKPR